MHEFGLCEAIVQTARARADGRSVARVTVRVGSLLRAADDSMEMAFTMISSGTELDGAALEIVEVPAVARCQDCGESFEVTEPWAECRRCGGGLDVDGGSEMVLESVEYRPEVEV